MKKFGFADSAPGPGSLKARFVQAVSLASTFSFGSFLVFGVAGLALMSSGCATQRPENLCGVTGFAEAQVCRFGKLALAEESGPATFSFQKAKGKLGSAKEAILNSVELGLSGPGAGVIVTEAVLCGMGNVDLGGGDPVYVAALAGAAGGVAAVGVGLAGPVVGARDLVRSFKTVSAAELAEREAALTQALSQMAAQQPFHRALRQTGAEEISGGFIFPEAGNPLEEPMASPVDAVMEARVDDLRLERAGSSEGSYYLRIKTHARVLRVADRSVCFQESAEYHSSTALFLDWTLQGAVEAVAETGYRELARHYVNQMLTLAR